MPPTKTKSPAPGASDLYSAQHAKHFAWIDWLIARTGLSDAALAEQAGLSKNYLYRKRGDGTVLHPAKIQQLCDHYKVPGPDTYQMPGAAGLSGEADRFDPTSDAIDTLTRQMVAMALNDRPGAEAWVLRTRALETAGYQIGDILISDRAAAPLPGDPVIATVYDRRAGATETIFRLFLPPYLLAASTDPANRTPILIDNERTIVAGAITQSFRGRRS